MHCGVVGAAIYGGEMACSVHIHYPTYSLESNWLIKREYKCELWLANVIFNLSLECHTSMMDIGCQA